MPLNAENVFHEMTHLEYAVRGPIVIRATEIDEDIKLKRKEYPFDKVIFCNVGNPQVLGNKHLTFPRQVIALLSEPSLLENPKVGELFPSDAIAKAKEMLKGTGHSGGYTPANGAKSVRLAVSRAIEARDNQDAGRELEHVDPNNIFMTNGASGGIIMTLRLLINDPRDGIFLPLPQYPLYSAAIQMYNGTVIPFYLCEDKGWGVDMAKLEDSFNRAKELHINARAVVVINPGNPTGRVLSPENMDEIIKFCHLHGLMIIADEVYQENVYEEGVKFHSFRSRLLQLGSPYKDELQLCSLHSSSKGMHGECGRRGGYLQMRNFPTELYDAFLKIPALDMCANITGQWMMELLMEPPKQGDVSFPQYQAEYKALFDSYASRAKKVVEELNKIRGVRVLPVEGAFYAFASLTDLPEKYIKKAEEKKMAADDMWCMDLLEMTGLVTLSGTGFGQQKGTWHFRTTIMPRQELMDEMVARVRRFQEHIYATYGSASSKI